MSNAKPGKKFNVFTLTQLALFSAIIVILTVVPYTGYISYGIISLTTIHIPVIIGSILLGPVCGGILGLVMGITSLLRAWYMPGSPLEQIIFMNPLVSILPRIIVGIVAALVFIGIMKLSKGKTAVSAGIAAAVGALTNTVLVLTMMNLLYAEELTSTFGKTIQTIFNSIFSINGLFEIVGAAVISIPIVLALLKAKKRMRLQ